MSYLKRLSVSLRSQVSQLVDQVEDHEAVVDAAIADARKTLANAKVKINRVNRDGQKLQEQIHQQRQAHDKLRDRARQVAREYETTALECLRRSQHAEQQVSALERVYAEHKAQQSQLQHFIEEAEQRLHEKVQRRNLMSTRQSALATNQSLASNDIAQSEEWEEAFERWEGRIMEMEISHSSVPEVDTLEYEFSSQERLDELRADLQSLIDEEDKNDE